jgi:hypothetical protein
MSLGALGASAAHQQSQKRNEGEVDELKEHRAMLAELHGAGSQLRSEFWHPSGQTPRGCSVGRNYSLRHRPRSRSRRQRSRPRPIGTSDR